MNMTPAFEYDRFIGLSGMELVAYMEPLVCDPATSVPKEVLDRMLSELPTYDEYHLIYALLLGADHSLETFISQLPKYLAHEHASVYCVALNALDRLPNEFITQALVDSVHSAVSSGIPRKTTVDMLHRLEMRLANDEEKKRGRDKKRGRSSFS